MLWKTPRLTVHSGHAEDYRADYVAIGYRMRHRSGFGFKWKQPSGDGRQRLGKSNPT